MVNDVVSRLAEVETRKPPVRDVLDATTCSFVPASTSALPVTVLPVASPAAAYASHVPTAIEYTMHTYAQTHRPETERAEHRGHHPSATGEGH